MSLSLRFIKICMVASIALCFSLIAFNNLMDLKTNFLFVQHVMSMDTTFHVPHLMSRAMTDPVIQKYVYYFIIGWQIWVALLCWLGALKLLSNIKEAPEFFKRSRKTAFWGLFFGFLLYMVGFIIIGGEWFCMWQSHVWNGQMTAGLFVTLIMFVMLFLQSPDDI